MPVDSPATHPVRPWHTLEPTAIATLLNSDAHSGLEPAHAARLLEEYGLNKLQAQDKGSPWKLLLEQFKDMLVLILLVAVALSAVMGHVVEAAAIGVIVLFAVLLGFVQEFRAERAMEALRKMAAPSATVRRNGEETEVPAEQVVPGDVLILSAGDRVPADARVIESMSMHADEAALTGESLPVGKRTYVLEKEDLPVADRVNVVYSGTNITYGRGTAIVTATGMQTEFGSIATMLQQVETGETPLQKQLDRVGKVLAKAALLIVAGISILGYIRGQALLDVFIFGVALAVAVVPEALAAVVTISLAIGVQRMAKRNALVRRLPAVETLGSTTVICSDKTGTLTKNEMTARRAVCAGKMYTISGNGYEPMGEFHLDDQPVNELPDALVEFLRGGSLSSDAHLVKHNGTWDLRGDPTEGAFVVAAAKAGLQKNKLDEAWPRVGEIPFTSETKRMTTLHKHGDGQTVAYIKGAAEVVLEACTHYRTEKGSELLTDREREEFLAQAKSMAGDALRVLAVARKETGDVEDTKADLELLGMIGMIDPPRPEAKEAVAQCKVAGISVVMITGDHPLTASAIAKELGILTNGRSVTGIELEAMDDATLAHEAAKIQVYARVSPAHKLRIVGALQANGHVVAMTGDGVNDAPALKKADIGIAMGITGTDVTKEAAAMTLTDDNFASIVAAVEEGRGIFGNIKKYLMYLLSANIGEIGLMTLATLMGLPLPLSAVQILYINLVTDGLPALALAFDPPEHGLMQRPPRPLERGIFTRPVLALMLAGGAWSTIVNLGLFLWTLGAGRTTAEAMTMVFVTLVLIEFFKAYGFRSEHQSVLNRPFQNLWLNLSILAEVALLPIVLYVPFLQYTLKTVSLAAHDWIIIITCAFTILPVLEFFKWLNRRGVFGPL